MEFDWYTYMGNWCTYMGTPTVTCSSPTTTTSSAPTRWDLLRPQDSKVKALRSTTATEELRHGVAFQLVGGFSAVARFPDRGRLRTNAL